MAQKRREKIFSEYPDVVSVKQMCVMLGGISMKTAYKLLECGDISDTSRLASPSRSPRCALLNT